ncbi:YpbB family protein [Metabacillus niabensis]|uniref:Uncharacterized protein YpbB n=1 Tax=Metabacillus niabensis TaxID=324854 RepID=A0ABT9Z1A6_9BACI|nr:helix-turn-helix domain-containing protein [Metabacillus niabensis]MDQ0225065.1 uncharacterized protein YpbB [Metabacillus niabensis]
MSNIVGDKMNNSYLHIVLLHCLSQFKGERTVSAIYHLLNGKKSSQTIQDGKLFNLSMMFGLFPKLSRNLVITHCEDLVKAQLIKEKEEQHFVLTTQGISYLKDCLAAKPFPTHLNGWVYGDTSRIFWRRISLLIQVLSNFVYKNTNYLPITKNQEDLFWVKKFIKDNRNQAEVLVNQLYSELHQSIQMSSERHAEIFIRRLTSNNRIGETFEQIALMMKDDPTYVYLEFWNVVHFIIQQIQEKPEEYKIFNEVTKDVQLKTTLTASTEVTFSYLETGASIQEIARLRGLKESTIEDHIVEITLHDQTYTPDNFLTEADYHLIKNAIDTIQTHRLKQVKEYLNDQYSYFQIRLAYALIGRYE